MTAPYRALRESSTPRRARVRRLVAGALCVVWLAAGRPASSQTAPSQAGSWNAVLDELLAVAPPPTDLTPRHFADELARTRGLLTGVRGLDRSRLTPDDLLDLRFVEAILVGREVEQSRMRRWRMDPRVYMSAVQTVLAMFGTSATNVDRAPQAADDAPKVVPERGPQVPALLSALRAIPVELQHGQTNLTLHVPRFKQQGLTLANAVVTILKVDVPALAETLTDQKAALVDANAAAREAVEQWIEFLTTDLLARPTGYVAVGVETYDALLKGRELADVDSGRLYEAARRDFDETIETIKAVAGGIDPGKKWQAIAGESPAGAPDAGKPLQMYQAALAAARTRATAASAFPIPWKQRQDVVAREIRLLTTDYYPHASRQVSREGDGTLVGLWRFNEDDAATRNFLGDHDGTIASVMAYGAYAEHALALYQAHHASRLRRALDSSTMAEGWGAYAEQLAQQAGMLGDERAHLRQLQLRLWRIARVIIDVGLHTGRMTEAQATKLMTDEAGLVTPAAELEIAASADAPASHLGHLGLTAILEMRDAVQNRAGERFSPTDFHEQLLKVGPLPPSLVRAALVN